MTEGLLCAAGAALLTLVLLVGGVATYYADKREWNNGVSPTGERWRYFDTDSQGSRGYKNSAGDVCWIGWACVDRRYTRHARRSSDRRARYDE